MYSNTADEKIERLNKTVLDLTLIYLRNKTAKFIDGDTVQFREPD